MKEEIGIQLVQDPLNPKNAQLAGFLKGASGELVLIRMNPGARD